MIYDKKFSEPTTVCIYTHTYTYGIHTLIIDHIESIAILTYYDYLGLYIYIVR